MMVNPKRIRRSNEEISLMYNDIMEGLRYIHPKGVTTEDLYELLGNEHPNRVSHMLRILKKKEIIVAKKELGINPNMVCYINRWFYNI